MLFLYDPPGGKSFASLAKGTSVSSTFSFSSYTDRAVDHQYKSSYGFKGETKVCVGFVTVFCNPAYSAEGIFNYDYRDSEITSDTRSYEFE
jgi:hypothetical protein